LSWLTSTRTFASLAVNRQLGPDNLLLASELPTNTPGTDLSLHGPSVNQLNAEPALELNDGEIIAGTLNDSSAR
jgi:hypothetical protein